MSHVFVAEEIALGRSVVVKVLPWSLADGVSAERFTREILLAARLQQANIVPLLSTGQSNGLPYYTMPFVEGQSLRDRLKRGDMLSIQETVSILRDVARALAYAHDKGIVHRDIKPENVLLSGHAAVVTDFGIAKAISAAGGDGATEGLTQVGTSIGTPAYMSPEQSSGDPTTDHRTDIYAFGCMAYELLSGRTPFVGGFTQLFRAHMVETPAPIEALRADVPSTMSALVMRCLAKDPAERPQSANEILTSLEGIGTASTAARPTSAATIASAAPSTATRSRVKRAAGMLALIAFGAIAATFAVRRLGTNDTGATVLAVLPFSTTPGDSAEYIADGTADELAIALRRIPGVRVTPRTATDHFRGPSPNLREIRSTLGAKYVVYGRVAKSGNDVKVFVQLANTSDDHDPWSQSFVRVATDLFGMEDDIARATSEQLGALLSTKIPTATATARGTSDAEAYRLYLQGQYLVKRRHVRQAKEIFEQAIGRDSNFARAYAGLSEALAFFPQFTSTAATQVFEAATTAANRAIALDSTLAQAHMALGLVQMNAFMWEDAGLNFRRAVDLDPRDAAARLQRGRFLVHTGRLREARAEIDAAKRLDPFSGVVTAWSCYIQYQARELDKALTECDRALQLDSTNAIVLAISSFVNIGAKRPALAIRYVDREPDAPAFNGYTAYVHGVAGDRATTERIIQKLQSHKPTPWFAEMATAMGYLGVRDTARALDALERSTEMQDAWTSYVPLCDPMYDPIRRSGRFARLLERVHLALDVFVPPPGGRCGGAS